MLRSACAPELAALPPDVPANPTHRGAHPSTHPPEPPTLQRALLLLLLAAQDAGTAGGTASTENTLKKAEAHACRVPGAPLAPQPLFQCHVCSGKGGTRMEAGPQELDAGPALIPAGVSACSCLSASGALFAQVHHAAAGCWWPCGVQQRGTSVQGAAARVQLHHSLVDEHVDAPLGAVVRKLLHRLRGSGRGRGRGRGVVGCCMAPQRAACVHTSCKKELALRGQPSCAAL